MLVGTNKYSNSTWEIYPNPAQDQLTFKQKTRLFNDSEVEIRIFNSQGELVKKFTPIVTNDFSLPITDLNAGIYFINSYFNGKRDPVVMKFTKI